MPMPAASPRTVEAETVPIGDGLCVFRRDNHALSVLNGTAAEIWQARQRGLDAEATAISLGETYGIGVEDARADIDAIVSQWHQIGLTTDPTPNSEAASKLHPSRGPHHKSRSRETPFLDAVYCAAGFDVQIRCHESVLASLLAAVLAPLEQSNRECAFLLEAGEDADGYWITENHRLTAWGLERPHARRLILRRLIVQGHVNDAVSAILHASSVEIEGRAVLIAGPSGSGKTTLTAGLVHAGAGYLADDLVPLSHAGNSTSNFPVGLAIKQGSWTAVSQMFPQLKSRKILETRRLQVRYLDLPPALAESAWRKVSAIILPRYDPGCALSAQRLDPEATFAALVDSGSAPEGTPLSIRSMVELANNVPAWQFTYSDLEPAVAWTLELVSR